MGDETTGLDWFGAGASTPSPDYQPSFNSPVTQDSFSVLDSVTVGVDAAAKSATSIIGSVQGLLTSLTNANAKTSAASQAAQLSAQQGSGSNKVLLAQSTAQQNFAQSNANIASAVARFTASPALLALAAVVLFFIAKKLL